MQPYFGRVPNVIVQKFTLPGLISPTLLDAWQSREISNFDYLMHLNVIAGRTFNDLSQYPVFPWVIADYTSKKLDLKNPETFRDFRYPMGAQLEEQRIQFMDKYDDLKMNYDEQMEIAKRTNQGTDCLPPFHYGSHYSCMGFVLWYLIRHEPFTSLGVWLQDGKFDKADRLFDSIEAAYRGCTTNMSDVKELIPEFYYTSEFLDNYNNVDLGITQTGKQLGAVRLPRWAKNSQDFVHQNREALECEFVSANLHHWIDLIFGYKQKPPHLGGHPAAVDAVNVYFHLTYAGAVDLDQLRQNEPNLYSQTVRQIDNFGQTPAQLFDKPHPQRLPFEKCDIIWPMASVVRGVDTIPKGQAVPQKPRKVICFKAHKISEFPILLIAESPLLERLVTVDSSRIVGFHIWQVKKPDVVPPYLLKVDNHALRVSQGLTAAASFSLLPSYQAASRERRIGVPFAPPQLFSPLNLAQTPVLYKLNRKLFCHEETERINQRYISGARAAGSSSTKGPSEGFTSSALAKATSDVSGVSTPASSDRSMSVTSRHGSSSKGGSSSAQSNSARKAAKTMEDLNEMGPESVMSAPQSRVDTRYSSAMFAYLPSMKYIFTCGHWDRSFKVSMADTGKLVQSVSHHRDIVTCLTFVSEYGFNWLVTGSRDCTVMVWEVFEDRALPLPTSPLYVLYGHDEAVTCVSVNLELDVILSGSDDGSIIVHGLRDGGTYIRSIYLFDHSIPSSLKPNLETNLDLTADAKRRAPAAPGIDVIRRVTWVGVSREGYIVTYSSQDSTLWTHTINGKFIIRREAGEHLHAFVLSEDGKVLITGGDRSLVVMRWVHNLELANDGPRKSFEAVLDGSNADEKQTPMVSPIRSLYMTKKEHHLLVGLESGELIVMTQDSDYLRRRLHYKLMEIGILPQNHVNEDSTF
jgi:WD40 repeat protein